MPGETLGILLISGGHERAHYAFMVAAGAAAIGRTVVLFATNEGCRALGRTGAVDGHERDGAVRKAGVAGLAELRDASAALGVRLMACESGLRMAGMGPGDLDDGVELAGIPAFLSAVGPGAIVTL